MWEGEAGILSLEGAEESSGQMELEAELGRGWVATWSLSKESPRLQSGRASRRLTLYLGLPQGRRSLIT